MCKDCKARRELARQAWVDRRISDAAKHVVTGAVEMAGLKEKTGSDELATEAAEKPAADYTVFYDVVTDKESEE